MSQISLSICQLNLTQFKEIIRLLSCKQYSLYIKIGNIGEMAILPRIQYNLHKKKSNDILHKSQEKFQNSYESISHSQSQKNYTNGSDTEGINLKLSWRATVMQTARCTSHVQQWQRINHPETSLYIYIHPRTRRGITNGHWEKMAAGSMNGVEN